MKLEATQTILLNSIKQLMNLEKDCSSLKFTILKSAFEGKLVPQDPNDEPAKILLQKIKQEKQILEQKQRIIKAKAKKRRRKNVK